MSQKRPNTQRSRKWPRWLVGLGVVCTGIGAVLMFSSYTNKPSQFNGGFLLVVGGVLAAIIAAIALTYSGRNGHNNGS